MAGFNYLWRVSEKLKVYLCFGLRSVFLTTGVPFGDSGLGGEGKNILLRRDGEVGITGLMRGLFDLAVCNSRKGSF